jgi:hypothetical protein
MLTKRYRPSTSTCTKRQRALRSATAAHDACAFPSGDELGVILSFMGTDEILDEGLFMVCKEWHNVLRSRGHAWNHSLDLAGLASRGHWDRPTFADAWRTVHTIDVSDCPWVTDGDVARFSRLPLRYLDVNGCRFVTAVGLAHLANAPRLTYLDIGHMRLDDVNDVLGLLRAAPLRTLLLDDLPLTDAGMAAIAHHSLVRFSASRCVDDSLTDTGIACLSAMPLERLVLRELSSAHTPAGLMRIPIHRLRELDVRCTEMNDAVLLCLSDAPIETLTIDWCSVTDLGMPHIGRMSRLSSLSMVACSFVTDAGIASLAGLPLHYLSISHCTRITGLSVPVLKSLPLCTLVIFGMHRINGRDRDAIRAANPALVIMDAWA